MKKIKECDCDKQNLFGNDLKIYHQIICKGRKLFNDLKKVDESEDSHRINNLIDMDIEPLLLVDENGDPVFIKELRELTERIEKAIKPDESEECKQCANPMLKGIHTCKPKQKIEKLEVLPDPYGSGYCIANKSMRWYAPDNDLKNQIDIIRRTVNQIIDYINDK